MPIPYTSQILLKRRFQYDDINLTVNKASDREIITDIQQTIEDEWNLKVAEFSMQGLPAWDGTTYRVDELEYGDNIAMTISPTIKYREIFTEPEFTELYRANPERSLRHLSIGCVFTSKDDAYVVGKTNYPHRSVWDIIGGGVQESELPVHTVTDLQKTLHKEILEEVGLTSEHFAHEELVGIVIGGNSNVLLIAEIKLTLSQSEIESLFNNRTEPEEMKGLLFLNQAEFKQACAESTSFRTLLPELLDI